MEMLSKLLLAVIAIAGAMGFARPQAAERGADTVTVPALHQPQAAFLSEPPGSIPHSFMPDNLVFPLSAQNQQLTLASSPAAAAISPHVGPDVGAAVDALPRFHDKAGTAPPRTIPAVHAGPAIAKRVGSTGKELWFPASTMPEPSVWMLLLCSFVVVAFIAQRKTRPVRD